MNKIIISMEKYKKFTSFKTKYLMTFQVQNDDKEFQSIFLNHEDFNEEGTVFMDLFKLNNEDFLQSNNIDYIEEDGNIIPIGIVDFQHHSDCHKERQLHCLVTDNDELYKCQEIIDNIIKAIKIKYKSETFKKQFIFDSDNTTATRTIELN